METVMSGLESALPLSILDILPNPVLVKDENLQYIWINRAFEDLFSIKRENVIGKLDKELFPSRQVAQCNGGDLRVLDTGDVDEAIETVFRDNGQPREIITRKSRLTIDGGGNTYLVGVMHDITDVTRANEALEATRLRLEDQAVELARLATTDVLTGCSNRRSLEECERVLFSPKSTSSALMMLDIDFFKKINDTYGHDAGDEVLRHFANLVRSHLNTLDYFIRLGGEEFSISMRSANAEQVAQMANQLRESAEKTPLIYKGKKISFTVSIGVAYKPVGKSSAVEDMLAIADTNLYLAKSEGRNQVVLAA